jgi:hypothetical protein
MVEGEKNAVYRRRLTSFGRDTRRQPLAAVDFDRQIYDKEMEDHGILRHKVKPQLTWADQGTRDPGD